MTTDLLTEELDEFALQDGQRPSITWLDWSGDVTITFDEQNREAVLKAVQKKIAEGYVFFAIVPRKIQLLGKTRDVKLTEKNIDQHFVHASGIRVPDDTLTELLNAGAAELAKAPAAEPIKQGKKPRKLKTAEDVVKRQSVATRPLVGG